MNGDWLNVSAIVAEQDKITFERVLQGYICATDVSYWSEDRAYAVASTDDDEVILRMCLPDLDSIGGIDEIDMGERAYLLPARLTAEAQRWLEDGLFEGEAGGITAFGLELRDGDVMQRLDEALEAERFHFVGGRPELHRW